MKKIIGIIIGFLFLINIVFAIYSLAEDGASAPSLSEPITRIVPPDLSNFPDIFVKDGNFNAVIVVGDKAPASDVIAQSNLVQFFGGYIGKSLIGSTKLSSEIDTLKQNIISIGSACHNNVSWEIMTQPKQCDRWLEPSKAMVILYDYQGYVHMVIAGYSDKGTRDAVDFLINKKKGSLSGANLLIDIDEPKPIINQPKAEEILEEEKKEEAVADIEKEKLIEELNKKIVNKSRDSSIKVTSEIKPSINKIKEKTISEEKQEQKEQKKETNVVKAIFNWFFSLFRK